MFSECAVRESGPEGSESAKSVVRQGSFPELGLIDAPKLRERCGS